MEANAIADTLLAARETSGAAKKVTIQEKYLYKAAGNAERQTSPTPPGVCGGVGMISSLSP